MYTNLSTVCHAFQLCVPALLLTIGSSNLLAQDPRPLTKIRGVTVTATPLPAGPNITVGVVRDTAGFPIPTSIMNRSRGKIAMPGSAASSPMAARAAMAKGTRNCPTIYVWLR